MKTFTTIVLFVLAFNPCWAQDVNLLDSLHFSDFVSGNWYVRGSTTYHSTSEESLVATFYDVGFNGDRELTDKSTLSFDENGNLVESTNEVWDEQNEVFDFNEFISYEFDANGHLQEMVIKNWDVSLNDWVNSEKEEYSSYDNNGNYLKESNYNFDPSVGWVLDHEYDYEYFYEGSRLDSLTARSADKFNWVKAWDYSASGLLVEDRRIYYILFIDDDHFKQNYEYNTLGQMSKRVSMRYSGSSLEIDYEPAFRHEFSYTPSGLLKQHVQEDFSEQLGDYIFDDKYDYFYPQSTAVENVEMSTIDVQWNNSMINQIEINISELDAGKKYQLSIFDGAGRLVKNLSLPNSNQWSQRYTLESGIYHMVIYGQHGSNHSEKIIVN